MKLPLILGSVLFLVGSLTAQSSFDELFRRIVSERRALAENSEARPTPAQRREQALKHVELVESFIGGGARGADKANARLFLTDLLRSLGEEERARETLAALETKETPPYELLAAAEAALMFRNEALSEKAETWIQAAIDRPAPIEIRARVATFLMTRLVRVEAAESIFTTELERAKDDEQRARILFFRCAAIREREDLPEGSYEKELEELASEHPDTYWGGIARDRVRAFALRRGSPAIPFKAKTLAGQDIDLEKFRGKVLLLDFWSSKTNQDPKIAEVLKKLRDDFADRGLSIVSVSLDREADKAREAAKERGRTWPQIWDGKAWETDIALRYAIEQVPYHILIDREGKIVSTRLFLEDRAGIADLRRETERALSGAR